MPKDLEQVMEEIRQMQKNLTGGQNGAGGPNRKQPSEDELRDYVDKELKGKAVDPNSAAAKHIADLLARNPQIRKGENGLAKSLPKANEARKEKMKQLRHDARVSGVDKVLHDLRGRKRSAAKEELKSIAQDKLRSQGKEPIADEKTALKNISAGRTRRKWRLLQPLMNYCGLGSYKERHNKEKPFPEPKAFPDFEHISPRTPNGKLDGMIYRPAVPSDKVVIFFSGMGGPAGEYCAPAVGKYLNDDATVVTMDYRGFGKSQTLNKKGEKTGTPLCEKTIYEDGKQMLKYVMEEMHVKPENIILHGFSLGGAVASKVAADFYQEQQKKALEEGRLLKEQKLGGIVLHSPIDSMYDAGKEKMWGIHLAGMLGWSGAGGYNTKSHMQRLHKLDPDLPVHYVSGSQAEGDHLDINATKINRDPKATFWNSSSFRNPGDHEDNNLEADTDLDELAMKGRAVQLGVPEKQLQAPEQGAAGIK